MATVATEPSCPACSRYDFEEKLLERVLRNELVIETMLNEIRDTVKVIQEDRSKLEDSLNGLEKLKAEKEREIKDTLHDGLKNLSDSLELMARMQDEMETKVDAAIKTGKINISEAITDFALNVSMTVTNMKKENEILKDQLTIPSIYFHAHSPADLQPFLWSSCCISNCTGQCWSRL
ncbi:hypothetical protein DPMN_088644 [Dreissena polymorpha]|uniref:Uncharacterized protein n=1 Tax=Dreissena polymorpha TaxID=45954 RepID=A0A9D4QXA5_DREPO|nr:hypothetical protein DPMN_088644 [Dreissena polymorpha]